MRWMFIGAAIILTGVASVATAQVDSNNGHPPYLGGSDEKSVSVWSTYSHDGYSTSFSAYWWTQTFKQIDETYSRFEMYYSQMKLEDSDYVRFGDVICRVVDPNSLLPNPGRTVIALVIDDLSAADCSGTITTCDDGVCGAEEAWTAPIEITGDMASMSLSSSGTENSTDIDRHNGSTRRYQCQLYGGSFPNVGGVTFRDVDGNYDYIPFVDPYPDEGREGTAQGGYYNKTCTNVETGRKPPK